MAAVRCLALAIAAACIAIPPLAGAAMQDPASAVLSSDPATLRLRPLPRQSASSAAPASRSRAAVSSPSRRGAESSLLPPPSPSLSPFRLRLHPSAQAALDAVESSTTPGSVSPAPLPFVVLHGIGDACDNPGMAKFVRLLSALAGGAQGTCIEIGDGFRDSWLMRLDKQAASVCCQILALPHLQGGFNLLGLSQGGLIARSVLQSCEGLPPVRNLVSIGGPQAGVASAPNCVYSSVCRLIDLFLELGIYSSLAQDNVAPAGYVKIPTMLDKYLLRAKFLPQTNNEIPDKRNGTFSERFQSLTRLSLIKFEEDTVLFPRETAHFEFFAANSFESPVPLEESPLYIEDWIGLRALMTQGKADYHSVPGNHLHLPMQTINATILPYLV